LRKLEISRIFLRFRALPGGRLHAQFCEFIFARTLRRTIVVVPLSTAAKPHPPVTIPVTCQGGSAVAVIDQIRAVAKHRLKSKIETLDRDERDEICKAVATILEIR
jgi:mRNA-degrading endonuclease toxin of MazEF toxin-antitoxin module